MKFPSISQVNKDAGIAFKRFPLSLIFAFISAVLACYLIEIDFNDTYLPYLNLLLTSALGLPLFFCFDTFLEKQKYSLPIKLGAYFLGLVILGLIYISFPHDESISSTRAPYIRYAIYNLTIHLLVAFVPSIRNPNQLDFWNYNKTIFLRLVIGAFYSAVLYIGVSLALGAIKLLFDATFDEDIFAEIFIVIVFIFNTWFFLAGAPLSHSTSNQPIKYPKGLKIFTQFILIPLLLIYLTILYFYGAKILISGDWPEGIVSYMIIAIAVLGIFTNLLLYPYQQWKDSSWMNIFYRAYYFLLFPLIILLFLAIGIRVQDYGLTVNRYIICCLGIWLLLVSLYYSSGRKNIKFIPISLAAFMILSSFGPWGMFSLSEMNQRSRLLKLLTENELMVEGKIVNEVKWTISKTGTPSPISGQTNTIPNDDLKQVNSIINYMENYHGLSNTYEWFDQDIKSVLAAAESSQVTSLYSSKIVVTAIGLNYLNRHETQINVNQATLTAISIHASDDYEIKLNDFDYLVTVNLAKWNKQKATSTSTYSVRFNEENPSELIVDGNQHQFPIDLKEFIVEKERLDSGGYISLPSTELIIEKESDELKIILQIRNAEISLANNKIVIQRMDGLLFIKEKNIKQNQK
jgi:hypothetical protein